VKHVYFLTVVFFCAGGLFSVNAQDIISLKDGSTIQAKVLEINPAEIKYKRFDNQDGPLIIISAANVISIKYPNGVVDVIPQTGGAGAQSSGVPGILQDILNSMPAITIAGNNLKFQFNGTAWTATLNGENFSKGTIEIEDTANGSMLSLKQTHIWPGAAAKTAGKIAGKIPGGAAVGGALNTAGQAAGAVGTVEVSGPVFVLEYTAGPSPQLSFVKSTAAPGSSDAGTAISLETTGFQPNHDPKSTIQFNISRENIEGGEREVLNINGKLASSKSMWSELLTFDNAIIKKLINGSGIRFKVIGDGKIWYLILAFFDTDHGKVDYIYYAAAIKTKKNKIVEIDIPYSKLRQPSWSKKAKFDKNGKISYLSFGMGDTFNSRKAGDYTIKIFDMEIY